MLQCQTLVSVLCFCISTYSLLGLSLQSEEENRVEILRISGKSDLKFCENATLECEVRPIEASVWWTIRGENITENDRFKVVARDSGDTMISVLIMTCATLDDIGNYSCHASPSDWTDDQVSQTFPIDITIPGQVVSTQDVREKLGSSGNLSCTFSGYPLYQLEWRKDNHSIPESRWEIVYSNVTCLQTVLPLSKLASSDNGTYHCSALSAQGPVSAPVHVFVLDVPHVTIEIVKVVGAHKIFLNWTVNDGNSPIKEYNIMFMKNGTNEWTFTRERVKVTNTSYVIKNLEADTSYKVKINAVNANGPSKDYTYQDYVHTLKKDPDIVPILKFKAGGADFINVGWEVPTEDEDHVHLLELELTHNTTRLKSISMQSLATDNKNMLFGKLASATTYLIRGRACSEYTSQCGNWSEYINGTTIDGESGPPENVTVVCRFDNMTRSPFVLVSWAPPSQPNGKIVYYNVVLEGSAKFKNEKGVDDHVTWGPKAKNVDEKSHSARFDMVPPNTNYTVKVAGVTRSRGGGKKAEQHCQMPPTTPDKEKLRTISWGKVEEQGRWMVKLFMPKVSERNGRICCFRVFVTKLELHQSVADLPPPQDSNVLSYQEVHYGKHGGTYLADMFESDALINDIFLGDGHTVASPSNSSTCRQCVGLRPRPATTTVTPPTTTTLQVLAEIPSLKQRRSLTTPTPAPSFDVYAQLYDGQLDTNSNYTGFVEVIVFGGEQVLIPAYTSYFETLQPGPQVLHAAESSQFLTIILEVMIVLILIVLILLVSLCLLQRYTKQVAEAQGVEISLRNSLRSLRGSHLPVSSSPPDMAPIPASQLPAAYLERHRDSDYGFQHEFELLPDGFPDRTTRASEARENIYKNRYPDIKAYDQTRVRLAQIDSIAGSDYVNANFVIGYKERKKFICAQGPMDNTVCDFWRMIWEQHLELILMLTNLEEYSKTKCAKYWADKTEGEKTYGDISISHVQEKRYSDYIIRELKMTRTSGGSKERENRSIVQYHFLVWKDFQAPEHPSGILKFIRRVNEAYSLEKGPILVHCSAGVGRTGTLVALDSLLQQLEAEGQVAIFNTVCDLRHQRNFLVQSLKQYIFVYRALQEVAQFGTTEIKASKLKCTLERLRQVENGKEKSKMEEEFEKMSQVVEERKSHSVGGGEENSVKNRSEFVIPYDRNRVILTPVPAREHSTYINASFIEGYDNSESFIITQDPIMEVTVADFWRMVSEQGISTLVMLSDLGDGPRKCPRYWPDDEIAHDHIRVKYIQSESCPYYTRRELCVTNIKTDEKQLVTQYQYNGWPTVEGEVPEVTRGLIELVDQTQASATATATAILVHCHCGSDRSSMFVALSILVQQLRTERRVDICTTVRKLRAQRQGMIQTFAQYEFLHRAIANYADLHQLVSDEMD
ncbi:tyrosine-protein phosphatase 69D-like [Macrosteles quadrilineatus]|uniref:tyrosine-protein phosphatase 69D-like n=1 Tax=Macrosteles quadrilineatus TaxID=74068 RepID=UPI0023E15851|nr:tyrosine-protein phosphatase 69D-like [Macrosteles quadrilineatus]